MSSVPFKFIYLWTWKWNLKYNIKLEISEHLFDSDETFAHRFASQHKAKARRNVINKKSIYLDFLPNRLYERSSRNVAMSETLINEQRISKPWKDNTRKLLLRKLLKVREFDLKLLFSSRLQTSTWDVKNICFPKHFNVCAVDDFK